MPSLIFMRPTPIEGTTKHGIVTEGVFVINTERGTCEFSYRNLVTDPLDPTRQTPQPESFTTPFSVPLTLADIAAIMQIVLARANAQGQIQGTLVPTVSLSDTPHAPSPVRLSIAIPPVVMGESVQFSSTITGTDDLGVKWAILDDNGSAGVLTEGGLYTAPNATGKFRISAISLADPSKSCVGVVEVIEPAPPPAVVITIIPTTLTMAAGAQFQFNATVLNASDTSRTWSIVEQDGGSIDANGLYSAPLIPGTYHVTVTSVQDNTKSATCAITVE